MSTILSKIQETIGIEAFRALEASYNSGQHAQVIAASAVLIDQAPDLYPLYALRGLSLTELGLLEEAIGCFSKALELRPGERNSLLKIAACLGQMGRIGEAIPYFAENFYLYPSKESATYLAQAAMKAGALDIELADVIMRELYAKFFADNLDLKVKESPLMHTVAWCEKHAARIIECEAAADVALTDADGNSVAPYRTEATRFVVVPNASVISGWDIVMAPTGELLDSASSLDDGAQRLSLAGSQFVPCLGDISRNRVFHPWTEDVVDIDEDVLFLSSPRLHHFGHWIYDYLPRLRGRRQSDGAMLKVFTLGNLPKAQRETLSLFNVNPLDLIEGEIGKVYRFKSLTVGITLSPYTPVPSTAQFLYQALALRKTPTASGAAEGRYFLDRSQTHRGRAIANPEELAAVLSEFHIDTIRRPELSVAAQNALFSEAGIIVCPFGTDLVTKFQVRPGTDLVVLQFKELEDVYAGIADYIVRYCAILGIRFHLVECGLKAHVGKIKYQGDLVVDCAALREALVTIIAAREMGKP